MNELSLIPADELYYKIMNHPKMIIEGLLSTGLAMLSGDPKIGKSWLVLQMCLHISRGESLWGFPVSKRGVVYLALEDQPWRIQDRLQQLTDNPPENLYICCAAEKLTTGLGSQIEDVLKKYPDTGIIFIDTLQMVRENVSSKLNAYAQDYKDLMMLKTIGDRYGVCIFAVHHTKKEHDGGNIFNDASGTTAITGACDTSMILKKAERFSSEAMLSITGRDVEERQLKLRFEKNQWSVSEEISGLALLKERCPPFINKVADYMLEHRHFEGTMTELLSVAGESELMPNAASRAFTKYYPELLEPLGIRYQLRRKAEARLIALTMDDAADDNDDV